MRSGWVTRAPAPPLRGYVDSYTGYRTMGPRPGLHRGLPSRHLTFIVSLGDPIEVAAQTDPRQAPARYDFVIGGLQATHALIVTPAHEEGVAVELTPSGCRALLRMPARALWDLSVEARDLMGPAAVELRERLHLAASWDDRFAVCDDVLGRLLRPDDGVASAVGEAWRAIVDSGGATPVTDLAAHVGWSRRHLSQRFTDELGCSPKLAARVVRFDRACRMLRHPRRPTIAGVAAACGYYDQPHLNRDFVDLAGCAPGVWLDAELPSVQDTDRMEPSGSVA